MKDGRQNNGEDFLTQPIHVLEHLMPLNLQLSILSKTNWLWMSTVPWHDNLLQIHTKVLIEALKISGVEFCNSWTLTHSQSLKTTTNIIFETENLSIHSLVSNVQQSRMGAWVGFQRKDLEMCTRLVGKQLEVDDFNCLISVIPDSTCFLGLEQLYNGTVTHVRVTMVMYC
jgi:hypothetical protein